MPEGHNIVDIVNGCIKANRTSQKEFYKIFYGFAMAICMRYSNSKDDALEIVNDGFLKILNELHAFNPRYDNYEASLRGWMRRIMINTAIDNFRKNNKHYFLSEINESHLDTLTADESAIDKMGHKEVIALVQRLSPVYRTIFNLHIIEGFKHEEIAEQLGISVGTSKSNLAKAKMNIKKMLKETDLTYYEPKAI